MLETRSWRNAKTRPTLFEIVAGLVTRPEETRDRDYEEDSAERRTRRSGESRVGPHSSRHRAASFVDHALAGKPDAPFVRGDSGRTRHRSQRSFRDSRARGSSWPHQWRRARFFVIRSRRYFIEPMQTIEANNELQTLREAEQREIAEILFRLSEDLRAQLPAIEAAAEAVAALDVINAKTAFARTLRLCRAGSWTTGRPRSRYRSGSRPGQMSASDHSKAMSPLATAPGTPNSHS